MGITGNTLTRMASVTIRELRHRGGDVIDRAAHGEQITITRDGKAVAELRAASPPALKADALLTRWRHLPHVDPAALRADLDELLDAQL
jgi:antitoxin (DNA-binding transcriptional repressor) of toxin-antitoxin stability system